MNAKLKEQVLQLSKANSLEKAKPEWEIEFISYKKDWSACACGHRIKEEIHIKNKLTGGYLTVGNICIEDFLPAVPKRFFKDVKALAPTNYCDHQITDCDESTTNALKKAGYFTEWEWNFIESIWERKTRLSWKQLVVVDRISLKVRTKLAKNGGKLKI